MFIDAGVSFEGLHDEGLSQLVELARQEFNDSRCYLQNAILVLASQGLVKVGLLLALKLQVVRAPNLHCVYVEELCVKNKILGRAAYHRVDPLQESLFPEELLEK